MNIRGTNKDIENIRMGHESESYATGYIMEHNLSSSGYVTPIMEAHEAGFNAGITFLANYLKEYGITIEIFDKEIKTSNREDWYSGEVIEKNKNNKIKTLENLWNEWRFTNEWKAVCQCTTFEHFLKDRNIEYIK